MKSVILLFCYFVLLVSFDTSLSAIPKKTGKKILLIPADHNSGILSMVYVANSLFEEGHRIVFLTSFANATILQKLHPDIKVHEDKRTSKSDTNKIVSHVYERAIEKKLSLMDAFFASQPAMDNMNSLVGSYLSDAETVDDIKDSDLAVLVAPDPFWSALIIPYKFDIPYLVITPRTLPWAHGITASPAAEPNWGIVNLDENSNIWNRILNLFSYVILNNIMTATIDYRYGHLVTELVPEKPFIKLSKLFEKAGMVFVQQTQICLDYPRMSMPHYHIVGGFSTQKRSTTKPEVLQPFLNFIDNTSFVLMTLGSQVRTLPVHHVELLKKVFGSFTDIKFIIRHGEPVSDCPRNMMFSPWIPQNDLMGNDNLKVFVTHGGINGQMEAIYHGVPTLVLAVSLDHHYNAKRAERIGTAESIDFFDITAENLKEKLKHLLDPQSKFRSKAQKCKAILQSLPSGVETVNFWVNHVLEFGYDHLQPISQSLPWYKLLMIDVFILLAVLIYVSWKVAKFIFKKLYKRCARKSKVE